MITLLNEYDYKYEAAPRWVLVSLVLFFVVLVCLLLIKPAYRSYKEAKKWKKMVEEEKYNPEDCWDVNKPFEGYFKK